MRRLFITVIMVLLFQQAHTQVFWLKVINAADQLPVRLNYPGKSVSREERNAALEQLLSFCREKGMLSATIDSVLEKGDTLLAWLDTGPVYRWARLARGNVEEEACSYSGFREKLFRNSVFNPRQVAKLMNRMLRYYQNNGYAFARISFDSVYCIDHVFSARLHAMPGDRFQIDSLNYRGDARISERYLQNYLGINPGDIYNEELITAMNTRLREIPFVQMSRPADVFLTGKSALIRLYLNDKNASNFSGIVGFLPNSAQDGKLLLTGEASLKVRNGLGRGESIDAEWRRLQQATQSLSVGLAWPFLFNLPFGFSGAFSLYKKDTAFISVQPNLGIQYLMRGTDYLKLYFEARNSSLLSTRGLSNISALPDYADIGTSLYGLEANITRLDYRFNPRKGYRLISRVSAGSRKIRKNVAVNPLVYEGLRLNSIQVNAMLDADLFVPLFRRATFNTGLMASWLESPSLFENELPRIGGINSLRGFNEESIFAASYAILNLEYRYLMDENAFIFVFVNGAWYENKAVNRNISDTPYGLGAGISFETKAGIFSLSYALGSEKGNPVQFRSAKVHFGLTSLF